MSLQLPAAPKRRAASPAPEEPEEKRRLTAGGCDEEASSSTLSPAPTSFQVAKSNSNPLYTAHGLALPSPPVQPTAVAPASTLSPSASMATGAASSISAYGPAYHHNAAGSQPARQRLSARRCGLRIGDVPFEDANLTLPQDKSPQEIQWIRAQWQVELQRQEASPPALPPSAVPPLPPKETLEEYHEVPETATEAEKDHVRSINCAIAAQSQKIDRERNNQAAKKSRVTRLEKLHNTRIMLNEKAAECDWQRLKVIQMGGDPSEWDKLSDRVKQRMIGKIEERVTACDQLVAEEKKRDEQRKRTERTRAKMQAKEASAVAAAAGTMPAATSTPASANMTLNLATPLLDAHAHLDAQMQSGDLDPNAHLYPEGFFHHQQP
jgi:hypothetical protein